MYYKAFGSAAAIHLAEQYHCKWLQDIPSSSTIENSREINDNHIRIVHQSQTIGDNEDEFYFSPRTPHKCYSCPNLNCKRQGVFIRQYSCSLTALDTYTHLNITHETLEQIWLSLLDVALSDKDEYELGEYKLRHIIGLSNSYSNTNSSLIEKSRSHNDILSTINKNNQKSIARHKSKSFDLSTLLQQSSSINDSANVGLLQGADISEPFADQLISVSIHSDIESIPSTEHEHNLTENPAPSPPPPPLLAPLSVTKETLNYNFNYSNQVDINEYDLEPTIEVEDKSTDIPSAFGDHDIPPVVQIQDTYSELSLFRPHSLSTIPSSRASQYASSIDSDDLLDPTRHLNKKVNMENFEDNNQYHISDDERGVLGSEFSSPQSIPLSSIQSRSLSPDQNQVSN